VESDASSDVLEAIAQQHNMTPEETVRIALIGRTIHVWRTNGNTPVPDMIDNAATHPGIITGAQPLYFHVLAQRGQSQANAEQYAPQKLHLTEAHRLASGKGIRVAVIDSEVDASHPDLAGAIGAHFRAYGEEEKPHLHGTGMAGAIAARQNMLGVAPGAVLLTVSAFSTKASNGEGTTFNILKGIDWAAAQGARVINMSFAGPADPRMREALQKANARGVVLVAAAGNAGPKSPPLYPAADTGIIAVTATNADDALFSGANRGNYITVAAPGVDVLAPAPESAYQFTTGTSVAAAEVSGVVALMLERNPSLTPSEVRKILRDTAKRLSGKPSDVGAGLVDAYNALLAAKPSS
jgi:subtilisin family serine protease